MAENQAQMTSLRLLRGASAQPVDALVRRASRHKSQVARHNMAEAAYRFTADAFLPCAICRPDWRAAMMLCVPCQERLLFLDESTIATHLYEWLGKES